MLESVYEESIIDFKTKERISISIELYHRCPYCIVLHSLNTLDSGATKEEILQVSMLAVAFGGGTSIAYSVTLLNNCIETFQGNSFTEEDRMEIFRRLARSEQTLYTSPFSFLLSLQS
nr:carboxymuconolactone decarboxylase family protein [Methanococcoides sp. NM1]